MVVVNEDSNIGKERLGSKQQFRETMAKLQYICTIVKKRLDEKQKNKSRFVIPFFMSSQNQQQQLEVVLDQSTKDMMLRLDELDLQLAKFRQELGPKDPYWYIATLGLHNGAEGPELLRQLCDIADSAEKACYTECATVTHQQLLEGLGFRTVSTQVLKKKKVKSKTTSEPEDSLTIYLMVRRPNLQITCHRVDAHHFVGSM